MATLGISIFTFFIICLISGLFLLAYYIPTFAQAFSSVLFVEEEVPFGWLMRRLHGVSANLLICFSFFHLLKIFYQGSYKDSTPALWALRVGIFFLIILGNFTGYFLPLSQDAFWGVATVLANFSTFPGIGNFLVDFLRGGKELGGVALNRFLGLHIGITALLAVLLIFSWPGKFWRNYAEPRNSERQDFWAMVAVLTIFVWAVFFYHEMFVDHLKEPAQPLLSPRLFSIPWFAWAIKELIPFLNSAFPSLSFILLAGFIFFLFLFPYFDQNPEQKMLNRPIALSLSSVVLVILIYFSLLGMSGIKYAEMIVLSSSPKSLAEIRGARIFAEKNCAFCHQINGQYGRREGPDMLVIGQRKRSPEWVQRVIWNASLYQPGTFMPRYELPLSDLEDLRLYLFSLQENKKNWQVIPREILLELPPRVWLHKKEGS